jgi:hypothetical protein
VDRKPGLGRARVLHDVRAYAHVYAQVMSTEALRGLEDAVALLDSSWKTVDGALLKSTSSAVGVSGTKTDAIERSQDSSAGVGAGAIGCRLLFSAALVVWLCQT